MNENTSTTETTTTTAADSLAIWLEMWNTGGEIALRICSPSFRIHLGTTSPENPTAGDDIRTPEDFARFLDTYRAERPDVFFSPVQQSVDGAHGRLIWNVEMNEGHSGGIDVFDFAEDGRISEVWSVTGSRPLTA